MIAAIEEATSVVSTTESTHSQPLFSDVKNRQQMQQRLLEQAQKPKAVTQFTQCVNEMLDYILKEVLDVHLRPFRQAPPLYELYVFGDYASVKAHIVGAPRAVLQMALKNPQHYLQVSILYSMQIDLQGRYCPMLYCHQNVR